MAFVVKQSECYRSEVSISLVSESGRKIVHKFDAKFRRLPTSRVEEIVQLAKAVKDDGDMDAMRIDDLLWEIIADWDGVESEPGKPLPYSREALEQILQITSVGAQILQAWFNSINHEKAKN